MKTKLLIHLLVCCYFKILYKEKLEMWDSDEFGFQVKAVISIIFIYNIFFSLSKLFSISFAALQSGAKICLINNNNVLNLPI